MLRILLLPSAVNRADSELFVGAVRELPVSALWDVPAPVWRELGGGQRKNCGVLVGVLSIISDAPPIPIFNGLSRAGEKQRRDVIDLIQQSFLGASASEMTEIAGFVQQSSVHALSSSSAWADEPLLSSLPQRRFVSQNDEIDFCFPVWQSSVDPKPRAKAGGTASLLWPGVRGTPIGAPVSIACVLEMISQQRRVLLVSHKSAALARTNPGRQATTCRISQVDLDFERLCNVLLYAVQDFHSSQWPDSPEEGAYTADPFVAPPPSV
jgi:hypothetical protein